MGPLAALWALLVPALLGGVVASEVIPHVNECSLCFHCNVDAKPPPLLASDLVPANFQPRNVTHKQKLPICHTCRGCTVHLTLHGSSGQKKLFNTWFRDEVGASPSWLFVAPTDKTPNRKAIVKVACIPVGKHARHKFAQCHADLALKYAKIYLAIEKLAENCGLTDIIPKIWVDWVDAVIPEVGYHIRWLGLWMEMVEGISLENLVRLGNPMMHPDDLLDILHNRVNHTQTVRAALFDLLTSQNDRHAQNIFINGDGSIRLIDNERAFFENRHLAADSILLPTTKKYTINVMENAWIHKFANWGDKVPMCWANVALLFDYRCYVKDGRMGSALPPDVAQCVAKIAGSSPQAVMDEYGMPYPHMAEALYNRSRALHEHGFEYALTEGYPRNPNPWRYKFTPPCCKVKHTDTYRCAHDWSPDTAIPFGDPITGGPWKHDRKDPGTYEGGTVF
ncbi:hypothetical protein CHLRE_13g591250v5 [Chlamydomonas reinhardtii]|uniref:PI3K/PI4K catalytic domain-containing protein n=1 Tax=Chlamydomonas reinhardtii TaxID=3055 RepID=A0A2K3D135_CHLRE|nr:uncharacterized protein CHLRE_13g591250v5 [Chlamydomonas reinhardtii]PNW74251.1 hypothetical protein CHLRE_13g591250v5 [Chlamydomonas reinhardtii]